MLETIFIKDILNGRVPMLDISQKYGFLDKSETQWEFSFEKFGSETGWFAWVTRPGQKKIAVGKVSEDDLIKKLKENPPPLTQDDFIDLELWMIHGGLDQYIPRKRKPRKKKETPDLT